jgi:hypothetical protein
VETPTPDADLTKPPRSCSICGATVTRWNDQYSCHECGTSWALVKNAKAETLVVLWLVCSVALMAVLPLVLGLIHVGVAVVGGTYLAVRLKRHHRYRLVAPPADGRPPQSPRASVRRT